MDSSPSYQASSDIGTNSSRWYVKRERFILQAAGVLLPPDRWDSRQSITPMSGRCTIIYPQLPISDAAAPADNSRTHRMNSLLKWMK